MVQPEQLQAHAERIRASGALGRSDLLLRLFNFFVACTLAGRVPKEIEVALDVFGKRPDFDVGQDALVRVYIHKLRRKLDEYYAGPGKDDTERLVIPKGEYRFVMRSHAEPLPPDLVEEPYLTKETGVELNDVELDLKANAELEALAASKAAAAKAKSRRWGLWLGGLIALLLAVNALLLVTQPGGARMNQAVVEVRAHPVWARMLDDDVPIYIVVGDYYIYGELDDNAMDVSRLVRDFDINSATDLEQHLKNNPELASRYMDMSLRYLPTSIAYALRNLMPLLEPNRKTGRQVQVILASDLTPALVKTSHIVYIGLLSGMGVLKEMVFADSHFGIGESYDELLDRKTGKHYFSQESSQQLNGASYLDYGFFSTRTGVDGNELVVLAGTRDVALMHMADTLTNAKLLKQLSSNAQTSQNFEALYSVRALDRTNLDGKLLLTYQFDHPAFATTAASSSLTPTVSVTSSSVH